MSIFIKNGTADRFIYFTLNGVKYGLAPDGIQKFADDEYVEVDEVLEKNPGLVIKDHLEQELSFILDEQNTGIKWHDGKTIYRKVIPFTNTPLGISTIETIADVDNFVKVFGLINILAGSDSGGQFPNGFNDGVGNFFMIRLVRVSGIVNTQLSGLSNTNAGHAIVEYTKV